MTEKSIAGASSANWKKLFRVISRSLGRAALSILAILLIALIIAAISYAVLAWIDPQQSIIERIEQVQALGPYIGSSLRLLFLATLLMAWPWLQTIIQRLWHIPSHADFRTLRWSLVAFFGTTEFLTWLTR